MPDLGEEIEGIVTRTARTGDTSFDRSECTDLIEETSIGTRNWIWVFSDEWTSSIGLWPIDIWTDIGYIRCSIMITIRIVDDLDDDLREGGITNRITDDERDRIHSGFLESMCRMCLARV